MSDYVDVKRSSVVWIALGVTAAFLLVFGLLIATAALPDGCAPGNWLIDRLTCLKPNELGDTFAGAFAPVAFVWLVAAVLLQRDELAAQRLELKQSREIAKQQFEESRKNVDYIRQQTEIMVGERDEAEARAEIKGAISAVVDALRSFEAMAKNMAVTHVFDKLKPFKRIDEPTLTRQL